MSEEDNNWASLSSRQDILGLMDSFIEHIQQIRRILLGMSVFAIVLASLVIALSVYVVLHLRSLLC
jgi:hypothetical protein